MPIEEKKYFEYTIRDTSIRTVGDFVIGQGTILNGVSTQEFLLYTNSLDNITNLDRVLSKYDHESLNEFNTRVDYENFPLKYGTVLLIPFEFADRDILRTLDDNVAQVDFNAFFAKALVDFYTDPLSEKYFEFNQNNQGNYSLKNTFQNISVWVWSKALSIKIKENFENQTSLIDPKLETSTINVKKYRGEIDYDDVIVNVTPFISSINTSCGEDGGNFNIDVAGVTAQTFYSNLYQKKWQIKSDTIKMSDFNKIAQSTLYDQNNKRTNFYFNRVIQENDVVFIRFETLKNETDRLNQKEDFFINKSDIQFKNYDFIGLVDRNQLAINPQSNEVSINISGRDLMKLLIEDGIYFYPFDYLKGGLFSNEKDDDRLTRYDGQLISKFQYQYRKINNTLKFLFNSLSNIQICSNSLFDSYGDRRSKFYKDVQKDKTGKLVLTKGIWQIVSLLVDKSVNERIIADGSIGNEHGSLINAVRKICQDPFVQFLGDTYGDKFYFIARKPPFDKESLLSILNGSVLDESGAIINTGQPLYIEIKDSDIENDDLTYGGNSFSWYMVRPQGSLPGGATMSLAYLKAVYFKEFADIFGSKPLDVVSNYIPYYPLLSKDQQVSSQYMIKQGVYDLKFLIETNQYLPFTRQGTITIANGNRKIKKGTFIKLASTNEIGYVDSVTNNFTITKENIERTTTINVSRLMVEKYIKGVDDDNGNVISYFNICNTNIDESQFENSVDVNESITSNWRVNRKVFEFFIKQLQFE